MRHTVLLLLALALAGSASRTAGPRPLRILALGGGTNTTHRFRDNTAVLAEYLHSEGVADRVDFTEDLDALRAERLRDYDLLLVYAWRANGHGGSLTVAAQRDGLASFVRNGKGLVVVHVGNGCFDDWPEFGKMVGGRWVSGKSRHTPYMEFTVCLNEKEHPLFRGLRDFQTTDELYQNLQMEPGVPVRVLATAEAEGVAEPMVWINRYGRGRVFYTALGHGPESWRNASFQRLLANAARWVARR